MIDGKILEYIGQYIWQITEMLVKSSLKTEPCSGQHLKVESQIFLAKLACMGSNTWAQIMESLAKWFG